jgi:hypothetical protein
MKQIESKVEFSDCINFEEETEECCLGEGAKYNQSILKRCECFENYWEVVYGYKKLTKRWTK